MMMQKEGLGSDALARDYSIAFIVIRTKVRGTMLIHILCSNHEPEDRVPWP